VRFLAALTARIKGPKWADEKVARSVRTIYHWMKNFAELERGGLGGRSRRPKNVEEIDLERRQMIVDLRLTQFLGCKK